MPVLIGRIDRQLGPIIDAKVMQTRYRVEVLKSAGAVYSSPMGCIALLDTGACASALDKHLIASLGLTQHGVTSIHTPSTGTNYETVNVFDACIALGETLDRPLVCTVPVIECEFASQGFLALIGRDILKHCCFVYDGPADTFRLEWA